MTEDLIDPTDGKIVGKRGAKAYKKWEPKDWKPVYEAMVALSCTGLSNEEVGKRFGYGKQQVSNILNTPQGKKLKEIITQRLRAETLKTLPERFDALRERALKNVEEVMNNDVVLEKAPLHMFDRSVALLKSLGTLKPDQALQPSGGMPQVIGQQQNNFYLSKDAQLALDEALKNADKAKELNGNQPIAVISAPGDS